MYASSVGDMNWKNMKYLTRIIRYPSLKLVQIMKGTKLTTKAYATKPRVHLQSKLVPKTLSRDNGFRIITVMVKVVYWWSNNDTKWWSFVLVRAFCKL